MHGEGSKSRLSKFGHGRYVRGEPDDDDDDDDDGDDLDLDLDLELIQPSLTIT